MLDERLKIRDESKNVIANIAKQSIIILFAATFFSACTDYQEEFENAFGALEYVVESSSSTPESSDGKTATKEKSSSSVKNLSATSSSAPASSGTPPMSSETVPTQSSAKSSSSAKLSSSSAASSSSAKLSSSAVSSSSVKSSSSFKLPSVSVSSVKMYGADYDVVTIGEQTWMAKSMVRQDVENFCYKDMLGNCNDNDRFYKWEQAKDICPEGWRLPDSSEWQTLFDAVGGQENAGKVLKSIDGNGSNGVEFNALLAGYMNSMNQYKELDNKACYWVADGGGTKIVELQYRNDKAYFVTVQAGDAYSVRCIKGAGLLSSSSAKSSSSVQSSSSAKSSSSVVSSSSITISSSSVGKVKDRAGNEYPVVQIGEQYWMAENLNYKTEGSACYDDQESNCELYGRLYTWEAAMTACPDGYRLPSQEDYSVLWNYANQMNGGSRPQDVLWVKGHWDTRANNKTGFSAYPGGRWNGSYDQWGREALFWTSTEVNDNKYAFYLMMDDANATVGPSWPKNYRLSVRCVKD